MEFDIINKEVYDLVVNLLLEKGYDRNNLKVLEDDEDIQIDSITFISMIIEIENRFNIVFPTDMLLMENFKSIRSIVENIYSVKKNEA